MTPVAPGIITSRAHQSHSQASHWKDNFLMEALKASTGLHDYPFIPSKDLLQKGRISPLEYSQYDSLTREAHFTIDIYQEAVKSVHLRLYKGAYDKHPCLSAEMIGSSIDNSAPFSNYSCVFKNVPPETVYHFTVEYADGRVEDLADPYSLGMISGRWDANKNFINPRSHLMDFQYLADFPSEMFRKNPLDPNKLKVYEAHVHITKSIPDAWLPEELRGTQGYYACGPCPPLIKRFQELGINAVEWMPIQNGLNERHLPPGVSNEWNYFNSSFVAPREDYCFAKTAHGRVREIQIANARWIKNEINPFLDSVLGHTSEGKPWGHPSTLAVMGNFLHLDEHGQLLNSTGCITTVNWDTPQGQALLEHILHVKYDIYNFQGIRGDQWPIMGRRNGSAIFDGKSPAVTYFTTETKHRGKILIAEPCDCHNGVYTSHHGEFPGAVLEQNVSGRDIVQNFTGGHCFQDFPPGDGPSHDVNNTNEGLEKKGRRDPIIRSLLSLIAPEYYHNNHLGKTDPKKPRDILFTACHDGLTDFDRTEKSLADLTESGIATNALKHVQGNTAEEKELYLRLHLWLANHALVNLRPGPVMNRYNSETLASQNGDHNAYTNPNYVQMDLVKEDDSLKWLKDQALRLRINLASFVAKHPCFDEYADNNKLLIQLVNIHGKPCAKEELEVDIKKLDEYSPRERKALGRFAGFCYTQTDKDLSETIEQGIGDKRPLFIAAAGCDTDFYLPEIPANYYWERVMDTQLETNNVFMPASCRPYSGDKENSKQAHYRMNMPGVAVFELQFDLNSLN